MIRKKINKIICLLIVVSLSWDVCYAANASFIGRLTSGDSSASTDTEVPVYWSDYPQGNNMYRYGYKREINSKTVISMNAYNLEGESIIPYSVTIDPKEHQFKAGTWIGINVTETHGANWRIYDIEYQEVKKKYTCTYTREGYTYDCSEDKTISGITQATCFNKPEATFEPFSGSSQMGTCKYKEPKTCTASERTETTTPERPYGETFSCPDTHPSYSNYKLTSQSDPTEVTFSLNDANLKNAMWEKAVEEVHKYAVNSVKWSSGLVKYITNDKFPDDVKNLTYNTIDQGETTKYVIDEVDPGKESGYVERAYEILENKVCMNLKTSKVTYGRDCNTSEGEIQIETATIVDKYWKDDDGNPREVNYWHYFIPLNAKSNSVFTLDIVKNENRVFNVNECEAFMEENDDYINYIVPIDTTDENSAFTGDYNRYEDKKLSLDYNKLTAGKGCNISTKIYFPIVQEFYNEVEKSQDKIILNGFNFYYRPIDVNDPFPNGMKTNSLWKDWNESTNDNPDISKSYDEVTYIATNINSSKIRNYTKNNPYTSWLNMDVSGESNFIKKEGIVTRNKAYAGYKLGCGPANENEYLDEARRNKNPLYIKGCDT